MRVTLLTILKLYYFFCTLLLLSGCVGHSHASAYYLAATYYQQGDYYRAFDTLWVPVQHHEPPAEYAMGYMYYYGIGTEKDQDIGRSLIKRASNKHFPPAMTAMRLITQQRYNQYTPFERYPTSRRQYNQYRALGQYPDSARKEGIWVIKEPLIGGNH